MISVACVFSLRNLPQLSGYSLSIILLMFCNCLFFFIPSVLVSAELASGWPQSGGVFLWVKEAFGKKWGLAAVFMQWTTNIPWFSSILAFVASSIAYIINPELASNKIFVLLIIWGGLWGSTIINFFRIKISSLLSSSGVFFGIIVPCLILLILGILSGHKKIFSMDLSVGSLVPKLNNLNQLMLLIGVFISTAGIEVSSVHITKIKNNKIFVKGILTACFIIIFLYTVPPLIIATGVPKEKILLNAGVLQAFDYLCKVNSSTWLMPIIAVLIAYGGFASVSTLMVGTSKALHEAIQELNLPKFIKKKNKNEMPFGVLLVQAAISMLVSLAINFTPSVSCAFWIMTALAAQIYLVMYILMFASALKLRYSKPNVKRPYKTPGGKLVMWIISTISITMSAMIILFGFIPPQTVQNKGFFAIISYTLFLIIGIIIFTMSPILLYKKIHKTVEQ